MNSFWINSLVVAAIVLVLTKSRIWACKRQFVDHRYQNAKQVYGRVSFIHAWWHALNTCAMCSGFWISAIVAWYWPCEWGWTRETLAYFFLNWMMHCLESVLVSLDRD